jgi:hypothetical protein
LKNAFIEALVLHARRQRLVWSDPGTVNDLLKKGLFSRIYEPQV